MKPLFSALNLKADTLKRVVQLSLKVLRGGKGKGIEVPSQLKTIQTQAIQKLSAALATKLLSRDLTSGKAWTASTLSELFTYRGRVYSVLRGLIFTVRIVPFNLTDTLHHDEAKFSGLSPFLVVLVILVLKICWATGVH